MTPHKYMMQAEHLWRHLRCEDLWAMLTPGTSLDSKPALTQDVIRAAALKVLICA